MALKVFPKDPNAILEYSIDWAAPELVGGPWLKAGETLVTSTWIVPAGITQASPSPSFDDTTTTIWLSGGTGGQRYGVVNRITDNVGRTEDRTIIISVNER